MKTFGEKRDGVKYHERTGCYGVPVENGRIGVIESDEYDGYFLTGGGVEEGEDERETLRREALEESGTEIEIGDEIGAAEEYFYLAAEQQYIRQKFNFYRIKIRREKVREAKYKLLWIGAGEIDKLHHESCRWIARRELAKN